MKIFTNNKIKTYQPLSRRCYNYHLYCYLLFCLIFLLNGSCTNENEFSLSTAPQIQITDTKEKTKPCRFNNYSDIGVFIKVENADTTFKKFRYHNKFFLMDYTFRGSVLFNLCCFNTNDEAKFDYIIFPYPTVFNKCDFNKTVEFRNGKFQMGLQFSNIWLNGNLIFNSTKFDSVIEFNKFRYNDTKQKSSGLEFIADTFHHNVQFKDVKINYVKLENTLFNKKVDFYNCQFDSILNLVGINFMDTLQFEVCEFNEATFVNVNFMAHAKWIEVTFHEPVRFYKTIFIGGVKFSDSLLLLDKEKVIFESKVSFQNTLFKSPVQFSNVIFDSIVDFSDSVYFKAPVTFYHVEFNDIVQFGNSISSSENLVFESSVTFDNCTFTDFVDFSNVKFESTVTFDTVDFNDFVDFSNVKFEDNVSFVNCTFNGNADFKNIHVEKNILFDNCKFPDTVSVNLDFSVNDEQNKNRLINSMTFNYTETLPDSLTFCNTKIGRFVKLYKEAINNNRNSMDCKLNITNDYIEKFDLHYHHFCICFDPTTGMGKEHEVYNKLLKMFNDDGMLYCYEKLHKEYLCENHNKLESYLFGFIKGESLYGKTLEIINTYWWGYAYEKENILFWTFVLFLTFYIINLFWWRFIFTKVYLVDNTTSYIDQVKRIVLNHKGILIKPEKQKKVWKNFEDRKSRFLIPLHYTAIVFFSLTLSFRNIKFEQNTNNLKGILGLIFVLLIHITGLICMAFIVNYMLSNGTSVISII